MRREIYLLFFFALCSTFQKYMNFSCGGSSAVSSSFSIRLPCKQPILWKFCREILLLTLETIYFIFGACKLLPFCVAPGYSTRSYKTQKTNSTFLHLCRLLKWYILVICAWTKRIKERIVPSDSNLFPQNISWTTIKVIEVYQSFKLCYNLRCVQATHSSKY